jgi:uncharacterized membrane protein YdbT with pleckstrin-like domain
MEPQSTPNEQAPSTQPQPVAYDKEGRPLYAEPPQPAQPNVVHYTRAVEPPKVEISAETKERHERSMQQFPWLNLSEGEFVISAVRRHPIGLVFPIGTVLFLVAVVASVMVNFPLIANSVGWYNAPSYGSIIMTGGLLILLLLMVGYINIWIYINNRFFLTNESVIQEIQTSLFARHEQTVSLANIEDASYKQHGIIQTLLNYGSIRLSTEGDETTYRFHYVTNPKEQIATLNNSVEAFKYGRPVVND